MAFSARGAPPAPDTSALYSQAMRSHPPGIIRVDHPPSRTHAWRVTVQRRGQIVVKQFSDRRYGGRPAALLAARAYRDHLLATLRPLSRRELCQIKKRSNRSGYVGVSHYCQVERRADGRLRRRWYWCASWTPVPGGSPRGAKFSVNKYGGRQAFRLAVATRRRALAELDEDSGREAAARAKAISR